MNQTEPSSDDQFPVTPLSGTPGRLFRLIQKELTEILGDRRTIITLFLMPILLYPLLSIAFQQFLLASTMHQKANEQIILGFASAKEHKQFIELLSFFGEKEGAEGRTPENGGLAWREVLAPFQPMITSDFMMKLQRGQIDVAISSTNAEIPSRAQSNLPEGLKKNWKLMYLTNSLRSVKGSQRLAEILDHINNNNRFIALGQRIVIRPIPPEGVAVAFRSISVEPEEKQADFPLATLVPLVLILMTITGAVYPAIDLTAGERERGTLEILVAAPVPRMGLLFAKYISVLTVAVLTALVNLTMMTVTVEVTGLSKMLFGEEGLSILQIVQVFGLLLLFAMFFSGALLAITSFARSFKEAQAYLIPLMLVSLAPGVAGMIPGLKLSPSLSLVPLLNTVLLGRDLLEGTASVTYAMIVVVCTLVYTAATISLAAEIFGSEDVLYNDQTGLSDMIRRPRRSQQVASISQALLCLCGIFFANFVFQWVIVQFFPFDPLAPQTILTQQLALMVLGLFVFLGIPLFSAWWRKVKIVSGFGLHRPKLLALFGAAIVGCSLWPFLLLLLAWLKENQWTFVSELQERQIEVFVRNMRAVIPIWLLVVFRIVPAIVEELFFRGFLFSSLQKMGRAWLTIIASAVLFGILHLLASVGFGIERLLPSTLLGLILGVVAWSSGSVYPAILLHVCHNALSVYIDSEFGQEEQLPEIWYYCSMVGLVIGSLLLYLGRTRTPIQALQSEEDALGENP